MLAGDPMMYIAVSQDDLSIFEPGSDEYLNIAELGGIIPLKDGEEYRMSRLPMVTMELSGKHWLFGINGHNGLCSIGHSSYSYLILDFAKDAKALVTAQFLESRKIYCSWMNMSDLIEEPLVEVSKRKRVKLMLNNVFELLAIARSPKLEPLPLEQTFARFHDAILGKRPGEIMPNRDDPSRRIIISGNCAIL